MSLLHDHLRDYLRDYLRVRRALGYKLERDGYELGRFIDALDARGVETITVSIALEWATRGRGPHSRPKRLRAIRGFARYLDSIGMPVEVPPSDLLPDRRCRAVPYLYAEEQRCSTRPGLYAPRIGRRRSER